MRVKTPIARCWEENQNRPSAVIASVFKKQKCFCAFFHSDVFGSFVLSTKEPYNRKLPKWLPIKNYTAESLNI